MKPKLWLLIGLTIFVLIFAVAMSAFKLTNPLLPRKESSGENPLRTDPVLRMRWEEINNLSNLGRVRPYTEREMEMIRKALNDPSYQIRHIAVVVLSEAVHDPKQRAEAVKLAISKLKDPHWLVRDEAVYRLGLLKAKEAIPFILPLLEDPRHEVRETVRKTLTRLGYKFGE